MEGYTNVSSNHEDFDDLDIEGRITLDEWNCEEEEDGKRESASDREENRLLSIKVKMEGGGYGFVFSVKQTDHSVRWRCHLCDVLIIGLRHVETHIQSKKHQLKMEIPSHPAHLFTRVEGSKAIVEMPELAPGEPVPPGFEDVVRRVTQIQATLDNHKDTPLIGLEYLVELTPDELGKEPKYVCMLCDKKGDPRVAMAHITSFNHRSKYIGIHFPTANKVMFNEFPRSKDGRRGVSEIVNRICTKIEEKYGRLQPLVVDKDVFETKKDQIIRQIQLERHFKETPEETFVELVDKNVLDELPNLDEVPVPKSDPKNGVDSKGLFIKGKISCDRSRLRMRGGEDGTEDDFKFEELDIERRRVSLRNSKRQKLNPADSSRKSLSSISSFSSSSRSRSRSLSKSRSRSRSRSRYGRHGWRDKFGRSRWKRSRSGSRGWRRSRSGSRPRSRRSRSNSPGSRYGRRGTPDSSGRGRYRYGRPGSPKYNRYRDNQNDEKFLKHKGEKSDDPRVIERSKWVKFRQEVDKIERELAKELKFHEKNPEKHPMYPEEWKKFWNRRYKELQADGKDPSKHDFKPEWIEFWNKRMKEMHEESLKNKKEELRLKLNLPKEDDLVPPRVIRKSRHEPEVITISPGSNTEVKKDVTVADIKNTWKALTGSEIKDTAKRSPSPWEEGEHTSKHARGSPPRRGRGGMMRGRGRGGRMYTRSYPEDDAVGIVTVLRLLTALENQLGSLGPRVNTLLASALSLEKNSPQSSNTLLENNENYVLLETVKEKLKGRLLTGIVERNMVMATRTCISSLADLLSRAEEGTLTSSAPARSKAEPLPAAASAITTPRASAAPVSASIPAAAPAPAPAPVSAAAHAPAVEPVTVPGVGTMDKVAIAQQIAAALVAQGRTNVTQEELEQLINAVVGMAQASAGSDQPISTAAYVSQMQQQQIASSTEPKPSANAARNKSFQKLLSMTTSMPSMTSSVPINRIAKSDEQRVNALELLQSAYNEPRESPIGKFSITNKPSNNKEDVLKNSSIFFKNSSSFSGVNLNKPLNKTDIMEDLTENDLQTLLRNFKDLSSEEQQGLISYLKKLEATDPEKVEKLRKFIDIGDSGFPKPSPTLMSNLKSSIAQSSRPTEQFGGRLSPFSLRQGGINPSQESDSEFGHENQKKSLKLEDSDDDDYSFEDIYNAASQKVKEREKAKKEEEKLRLLTEESKLKEEKPMKSKTVDPTLILKETKEMIANLMGELPAKFLQKQTGQNSSSGTRKDSPLNAGGSIQKTEQNSNLGGQRIQALGSETAQISNTQVVPTLDSSHQMYYPNSETSYSGTYGSQNYPGPPQSYPGSQPQMYSDGYQQSGGYYGSAQQHYPQNNSGNYNDPYQGQGPNSGGWSNYSDQYRQQPYQRPPGPGPYRG